MEWLLIITLAWGASLAYAYYIGGLKGEARVWRKVSEYGLADRA